jgi:radical SAM protein with 4Fe4S-binding SPASM domain
MRSFSDRLNLLSKTSPGKLINASRVLSSYYISRISGMPNHRGLPFSIGIEPTTSCNLRCPECPSGLRSFSRPTGNLSSDTFTKVIDQLSTHLIYLTFYFQGEPYLHPKFLEMVSYASGKGIYTSTSTNAHYLDETTARRTVESGLDRIIISIDGADQETYQQYRVGGSFERVIHGTKELLSARKKSGKMKPHVAFQFLVVKPNEHQVTGINRLGENLGVDEILFKTAQIYDFENGSPLIPDQSKFSRYHKTKNGNWEIKNSLENHCWKMWHSCVITWDGAVVPCCFDKDASHSMGNINEMPFKEIWEGEKYRKFRQSLLSSRKEIDICKNCTEGTTVWV